MSCLGRHDWTPSKLYSGVAYCEKCGARCFIGWRPDDDKPKVRPVW